MVVSLTPIGSNFSRHAEKTPNKPALICDSEILSWRDLANHVDVLSRWFDQNAQIHARIGLLVQNSLILPVLFSAIAGSGREALILDASLPDCAVQDVITHVGCNLIISSRRIAVVQCPVVRLSNHASLEESMQNFYPIGAEKAEKCSLDDPFYTGVTSGTSGLPKAYRRTHRSWIESFAIESNEFHQTANDIILAPGALSHSLFLYAVVRALHIGATAIIMKQYRPDRVLRYIGMYGATIFYSVPSQIGMLLEMIETAGAASDNRLRWLISSGSKWNGDHAGQLKKLLPHGAFAEFYGASELSFVSVARSDEAVPHGSVGRAFKQVDIKICDGEKKMAGTGEIGEIWVRSPMLFSGYAHGATDSVDRDDEGYLTVGDIGYLDREKFLFLAGRNDRMIVTSGKNLYPEEIEAVFSKHRFISEFAVIPVEDAKRGHRPVGLIKFKQGVSVERTELIAYARTKLPSYKVPRSYFLVSGWPWLRSGKTDFSSLRHSFKAGKLQAIE